MLNLREILPSIFLNRSLMKWRDDSMISISSCTDSRRRSEEIKALDSVSRSCTSSWIALDTKLHADIAAASGLRTSTKKWMKNQIEENEILVLLPFGFTFQIRPMRIKNNIPCATKSLSSTAGASNKQEECWKVRSHLRKHTKHVMLGTKMIKIWKAYLFHSLQPVLRCRQPAESLLQRPSVAFSIWGNRNRQTTKQWIGRYLQR